MEERAWDPGTRIQWEEQRQRRKRHGVRVVPGLTESATMLGVSGGTNLVDKGGRRDGRRVKRSIAFALAQCFEWSVHLAASSFA
jgi:hypothetical protein